MAALQDAAMEVFAKSGVDGPVRTIAEAAGVGLDTVYRHFPQRSDLIATVFQSQVKACANAAAVIAGKYEPAKLNAWPPPCRTRQAFRCGSRTCMPMRRPERSASLSHAAASLKIPLHTVSRALKRIEHAAKLSLIRRSRGGLNVTSAGKDYASACEAVLKANDVANEVLRSHRNEPQGTLRIGAPIAFVRDVIAPLIPMFLDQNPRVRIELDPYCSGWDQEPRIDHDLFVKVRSPRDSEHRMKVFPGIRRARYASPAYLAQRGCPRVPDDLRTHEHLTYITGAEHAACSLRRDGETEIVLPSSQVAIDDPDVAFRLTLLSAGIAPLSCWMVDDAVECGELVRLLPEWELDAVFSCVLYGIRNRMNSSVEAFVSLLQKNVGSPHDPRISGKDPRLFFLA